MNMAELELKQSLERARFADSQNAHDRAIKEDQRLRDERERFIAKQNCEFERVQFPNCVGEMLFANGARLMDTHHGVNVMIEAPADPRERLLNRRTYLKRKLQQFQRQYSEQVDFVRNALAVQRMGAGPGCGNEWKSALPAFADQIEAIIRELNDIQAQMFPQGMTQMPPSIRQQAAADTEALMALPQFK